MADQHVKPVPKRRRLQSDDIHAPITSYSHSKAAKLISSPCAEAISDSDTLRIYAWNINGIQPFVQPSVASYMTVSPSRDTRTDTPITTSLRNFLRRHSWPHVLHLQEVKINPSDESTKSSVRKAVNTCRSGPDDGPDYVVHFCLPHDKHNAKGFGGKIYGVASIIRRDFYDAEVANVRSVAWDLEGRVLVVETHSKLSLWNIYAVNGTTNPYRDPRTGKQAGTRHDRKLAFHAALLDECKQLEASGWYLILAGDLNVARAPLDGYPRLRTKPDQHVKNRADFNRKFFEDDDGLCAIDTFRLLNPQLKRYSWLPRHVEWKSSCDRVDYILASRSLQGPPLLDADVLMTETDRGPSDHVPVYLKLDKRAIPDAKDDMLHHSPR